MRYRITWTLSCIVLATAFIIMSSSSSPAPPRTTTSGGWVLHPANPVLGGTYGVLYDVSVLPPSSSNAHYRMYNSWKSDPQGKEINCIGYTESRDGITWGDVCVVLQPSSENDTWEPSVNRPSVIEYPHSDSGEHTHRKRYHMWYTGQTSDHSYIGCAESDDGIHWHRVSPRPVFEADSNTWEKVAVMCPHVVYSNSPTANHPFPYRLYYSAGDQTEPDAVGVAFSQDGIKWSKSKSSPVFLPDADSPWEAAKVTGAHVFYDSSDDYYYMFYIGFADIDTASINLARSRDGLTNWERHPDNPLIPPTHDPKSWIADAVYKPYAWFDKSRDMWLLWFNGRCGDIEAIGVATHKGHDLGFSKAARS